MKHWASDFYWWVKFRLINRYNVIEIDSLEPAYHEVDTRLFHACFDLLVQFVEYELAGESFTAVNTELPWWKSRKAFIKRNGVVFANEYFTWALTADEVPKHQVEKTKEIKELYDWYKFKRPKRVKRQARYTTYDESVILHQQYDNEDTDMLIRLVKARHNLWT